MKKAGCVFINFGLESGSEKILFLNQKNIRISVIEETVAACQKEGLAIGCFKLLGLSGETRETFVETLQFMLKNKIFIPYPFPIVKPLPYPGTILHSLAEKQFRTTITWANCYRYAGKVGTKFFQEVSMAEIQRLAYQYRLKQESRLLNKHYLKLLSRELLEKITKFLH